MSQRVFVPTGVAAIVALASLVTLNGQAPKPQTTTAAKTTSASKTSWGDPDLQGIWTSEEQVPLQRPAKYAGKELFTDAEIAQLDRERAAILRRDYRAERGTEADVAGAYNAVFQSVRHTGRRTSLVVDPPDGKIPPLTPEAQKKRAVIREFQVALLQATDACK